MAGLVLAEPCSTFLLTSTGLLMEDPSKRHYAERASCRDDLLRRETRDSGACDDDAGSAARAESVPQSTSRLRIQAAGNGVVAGGPRSSHGSSHRDRQRPPRERGLHRSAE